MCVCRHTHTSEFLCADGPVRELICSLTTYTKARGYKERKDFTKKCIVQMMLPYSRSVIKLSADQFLLVKASLIKWNGMKISN